MIVLYTDGRLLSDRFCKFRHKRFPLIRDWDYALYVYDIDLIEDNEEAYDFTELCFRFDLEFMIVTREEAQEEFLPWEDFFQSAEQDTKDLEFLNEMLSRH